MQKVQIYNTLNFFIASVWLINGLFCKVLNLLPRHQEIVGEILGQKHAVLLTLIIGIAETGMTLWILSRIQSRLNATIQVVIVLSMNILEFWLVPDLLLWGRLNLLFAVFFAGLVYYNEFVLDIKFNQLK